MDGAVALAETLKRQGPSTFSVQNRPKFFFEKTCAEVEAVSRLACRWCSYMSVECGVGICPQSVVWAYVYESSVGVRIYRVV
jgi:hypothetical protein